MKKSFKKQLVLVATYLLLFLVGCEKVEQSNEEKNLINQPETTNFVSIDKVPFLVPAIENFNSDYKFLSNPSLKRRGGIENLNLDLNHILEFVSTSGLKTYSVTIKSEIPENEPVFFENLHLVQIGDKYAGSVIRYISDNPENKLDITNFTGTMQIFNIDGDYEGSVIYSNGLRTQIIPNPVSIIDPITNASKHHGWVWCFFYNLFHGTDSYGDLGFCEKELPSESTNTVNNGYTGNGSIIIAPCYTCNIFNSPINSGTGPSGGTGTNGVYIITNPPSWTDDDHPTEIAKTLIKQRIISSVVRNWINSTTDVNLIKEIYYYMWQNQNSTSDDFIKNVIIRIAGSNGTIKSIKPFIIEKKIFDTDLDPCAKNVLDILKNTTVCDIAQVLAKLDADSTAYNTIIKSDVPPDGSPAQTIYNSRFNYTIFISTNYTGKTKLFIANLIIHEMVHAYFLSIVDDYKSNPNNNQFLYDLSSFPSLFQAYCDKKYPPTPLVSQNLHHIEMANYYVDAISRALQEYQTGIPVASGSSPNQIYTDLAWAGLNNTPIFDATYPIGNPNRDRILNRGAAEQTGNTIGAGTTNSQMPISQPCN